jgi:hypothetical protein
LHFVSKDFAIVFNGYCADITAGREDVAVFGDFRQGDTTAIAT